MPVPAYVSCQFPYDYQRNETVPLKQLEEYLRRLPTEDKEKKFNEAELALISRHLQRVKFYIRLEKFGYKLFLKPVKLYNQEDGSTKRKANCDVDMAFHLMKEKDNFERVVILSGDGDFLPVLKHLKEIGKEVVILGRGERTAKEIKQFAGGNFKDFVRLEKALKYAEN
jgi:uncharacterized LabA/DUF88 family protein